MFSKSMVKAQIVLLAFLFILAGCNRKEEPKLPIVIVEKPSKEDVKIFRPKPPRRNVTWSV